MESNEKDAQPKHLKSLSPKNDHPIKSTHIAEEINWRVQESFI
jgi:hypothetical protein